jgi:MFS family permease
MTSIEKTVDDSFPTLSIQPNPGVQENQGTKGQEDTPFSIFTYREKKWISFVASFGAMFSTLSSYIYMPALVPIATDLGVSIALVNLTVTSYLVVAGIAPAFMGDIADQGGRRPAYILMFALVVTSNIGLALQNSYAALLILRMVQSAGASGTCASYSMRRM